MSGKVIGEHGEPIADAEVRVEAIFGFAGGDFLGQRTFATRTTAKGEWRGAGRQRHRRDGAGMWHPVLRPAPRPSGDTGQLLADAPRRRAPAGVSMWRAT